MAALSHALTDAPAAAPLSRRDALDLRRRLHAFAALDRACNEALVRLGEHRGAFVSMARERRKTAQAIKADVAAMGPEAQEIAAPYHFELGGLLEC